MNGLGTALSFLICLVILDAVVRNKQLLAPAWFWGMIIFFSAITLVLLWKGCKTVYKTLKK